MKFHFLRGEGAQIVEGVNFIYIADCNYSSAQLHTIFGSEVRLDTRESDSGGFRAHRAVLNL